MKLNINIKGVKKTVGEITKYDKAIERIASQKVEKYANKIRNEAIKLVPVDEGILQGSIEILRGNKFEKEVGTNLEYAAWIEFGQPIGGKTPGRKTTPKGPRPYLRPAAEKFRKAFTQELRNTIRKA